MRSAAALTVGLALLQALFGCHSGTRLHGRAPESWIHDHGGLVTGSAVDPEVRGLRDTLGLGRHEPPIRVGVLGSSAVEAFAWPSGEIFLTRGLIGAFDEGETAAALAHEIGHLRADAPISGLSGLPSSAGSESEHRADILGYQLLEASGIPGSAMVRMLEKVRDHLQDREDAAALTDRIDRLEHVISHRPTSRETGTRTRTER